MMPQVKYFDLFRFASKSDKIVMIIGSIFAAINGATMPFFMYLLGDMINSFSGNDPDEIVTQAGIYSVYFVYVGIVSFVCSWLMFSCWIITGER